MVNKADITSSKPSITSLITVADGETVLASTENFNNNLSLANLITLFNYCIDSSVDFTATQTFSAAQTFGAGIKVNDIQSTTGAADIIVSNGTLKLGSAATNAEAATQLYVQQQIAGAGAITLNLTYGGIQTSSFTAVQNYVYHINGASSAITATLPASPTDGDVIKFVNYENTVAGTNSFTVAGNGNNIAGDSDNQVITRFVAIVLRYDATNGWRKI